MGRESFLKNVVPKYLNFATFSYDVFIFVLKRTINIFVIPQYMHDLCLAE